MSTELIDRVWKLKQLRGAKLLVLLAIAEAVTDRGNGCVSYRKISENARVDSSTAKRMVRALRQQGLLLVGSGQGKGQGYCNAYQIHIPRLTALCQAHHAPAKKQVL